MPKPTKGPRLGGGPAHERLLLANLATALFTHKAITTTETKAKRLRPLAERLVTFAKRGDLHSRRRVLTVIRDKSAVHELFTEIAPQVADRNGGYTRIIKLGYRKGDNAPLAKIELVLEPLSSTPASSSRSAARNATPSTASTVTPAEASVDEQTGESATADETGVDETATTAEPTSTSSDADATDADTVTDTSESENPDTAEQAAASTTDADVASDAAADSEDTK